MSERHEAETPSERTEEERFPTLWPAALGDMQTWIDHTILMADRRLEKITVWIGGPPLLAAKRQGRNIKNDFAEFRAALSTAHGAALKLDYDETAAEHRVQIIFRGA